MVTWMISKKSWKFSFYGNILMIFHSASLFFMLFISFLWMKSKESKKEIYLNHINVKYNYNSQFLWFKIEKHGKWYEIRFNNKLI